VIDCHVHSDYTIDSTMSIEEAAKRAAELGLEYMCFVQHLELTHMRPGEVAMDPSLMGDYFKQVERAATEHGVRLGAGIEVGFLESTYPAVQKILDEWPFDFVIGSVHEIEGAMLTGAGLDEMRNAGADSIITRYFNRLDSMMGQGFFDVAAHFDVLNKHAEEAYGKDIYPLYRERAIQSIKTLKKSGKGFEVNTQGLRRIGHPWPREELVQRMHDAGIKTVCFGSDAHEAGDIAYGWDGAVALLRNAGYTELSYFVGRKRKTLRMP
jgi:histidinol-phosphatase (PHP family)